MIHTTLIPAESVFDIWPEVEPIIKRAVAYSSGRYETADILDEIFDGTSNLWVAFRVNGSTDILGTVITKVAQYPRKRFMGIIFCAGNDLDDWQAPMLKMIEGFAQDCDCDGIEIVGRPGWVENMKKFGYSKGRAPVVLEKIL